MVNKAKTNKVLKQFTPTRTNLASVGNTPLEIPNHSRGKAPESDKGLANKQYVDDADAAQTLQTITDAGATTTNDITITGDIQADTANLAGMDISNDGTKTTFLGTAGDYNRIGDAGTTSASLDSEDDLLVTGQGEFTGTLYLQNAFGLVFNANTGFAHKLEFKENGSNALSWQANYGTDEFKIGTSSRIGNQLNIVADDTIYMNCDHTVQTNPTLYIHSNTAPNTNNTQWLSLTHDQTDGVIEVGKGTLTIGDGTTKTNYLSIAKDGELNLYGTARVKKEFGLLLTDFNPGASGPTKALHDIFPTYEFTIGDDMHTSFELPTDWEAGTDIEIEVYWAIDEAYATNSGEVRWSADWRAVAVGELISGGSSGTCDFGDVDIDATANTVIKTECSISGASLAQDDLIAFNGSRVALVAGNNPTAEPYIVAVRVEYTANKLGEAL